MPGPHWRTCFAKWPQKSGCRLELPPDTPLTDGDLIELNERDQDPRPYPRLPRDGYMQVQIYKREDLVYALTGNQLVHREGSLYFQIPTP